MPSRACAAVTAIALVAAPGSARAAELSEAFEAGAPGWAATGLWHVQQQPEAVAVSPAIGGILTSVAPGATLPAARSGRGAAWFGDRASGTYCAGFESIDQHPSDGCRSGARVQGTLTSPAFAVPRAPARLRFSAWWEIAAADHDRADLMTVDYSVDGGATWTRLGRMSPAGPPYGSLHQAYTSGGLRAAPVWREHAFDLGPAVGGDDVRVRFGFDSVDELGQGFRGLLVDDVVVEGSDVPGSRTGGTGLAPETAEQPAGPAPPAPLLGGPVFGASVELERVSGRVRYRLPRAGATLPLVAPVVVPFGTAVDARRGTVRVTAAGGAAGTSQTGTFHAGAFLVRWRAADATVELMLRGGSFPHCPSGCASAIHRRRVVRRLWGSSTGRFRSRGRYAAGTVRGTAWLVEDRPGETRVHVRRGSVLVRDFVRDRDVVVRAGGTYRAQVVYTNRVRGNPRFGQRYTLDVRGGRIVHVYRTRRIVLAD